MALSTRETPKPAVGATRARQGRLGRHVFWVLLFGTLLAALALFAAWTWRSGDFAETTADNGRAKAEARMFDAPEPAPVVPQPGQDNPAPDNLAPAPQQ